MSVTVVVTEVADTAVVVEEQPPVAVATEEVIDTALVVTPAPDTVVVTAEVADTVVVVEETSAGPSGPQGPQGPPGPSGDAFTYVHSQSTPQATWTITHSLGGYPNVSVVDSGGTTVVGEVTYLSANQLEVVFTAPFGGTAYLS